MITENYLDCSNFTSPWTPEQLAFLHDNYSGVVIGLQNADKARAFQQQAQSIGLERAYYVDIPGRDLTIPEPGSFCFSDVEVGCITTRAALDRSIADTLAKGLQVGIYGNQVSIAPVLGNDVGYAVYPLWYANYRSTPPTTNAIPVPFNGWSECLMWQWSSEGVAGINADLNVLFASDPVPPPAPEPGPTVTHRLVIYSDGSYGADA